LGVQGGSRFTIVARGWAPHRAAPGNKLLVIIFILLW
jgi:hypothetical protein